MKNEITCAPGALVKMEGATKSMRYDDMAICQECKGRGVVEESNYPERGYTPRNCPICKGSGKVFKYLNINIVPVV